MLLDLVAASPNDAEINYQATWVPDTLGREREAVPFYVRAIELGLSDTDGDRRSESSSCQRDLASHAPPCSFADFVGQPCNWFSRRGLSPLVA